MVNEVEMFVHVTVNSAVLATLVLPILMIFLVFSGFWLGFDTARGYFWTTLPWLLLVWLGTAGVLFATTSVYVWL